MAEHIYTYADPPSKKHLAQTCHALDSGDVICYPVGANWAFGCDPTKQRALEKLKRLKSQYPKSKSLSLLCADISMAAKFGQIDHSLYRVLKRAWPGPYTVIVPSSRDLPRQLKDKRQVVGLRVPESPLVRALIEAYQLPLASSSVPPKDSLEPFRMGYEIDEVFGHALGIILDLGEELTGEESTVIDVSEGVPTLMRQGLGDCAIFGITA